MTETILPNAEPFFYPGGKTGCILVHGFSSSPEEMRLFGQHLANQGYTVMGVRLAGHGTHPDDLKQVHWQDWLANIEDYVSYLEGNCTKKVFIGQSMGGMISLTAAAYLKPDAVVALSTPYLTLSRKDLWINIIGSFFRPMIKKDVEHHPVYGIRREAGYPAYAAIPAKIFQQTYGLAAAMHAALPHLDMPTLIIQSDGDLMIPPNSMEQISAAIPSKTKRTRMLAGLGHGMALDPKRDLMFAEVLDFLADFDLLP